MSEHWVTQKILLETIHLHGFTLGTSFCRQEYIHGGVCIFLRNEVKYRELDANAFCAELHTEFCAVHLQTLNCLVVTVDRSTNGVFEIFLDNLNSLNTASTDVKT